MRASEAPQQGRPRGAERLHMAFQGMLVDQDSGAWASRQDKLEVPLRGSVTIASTRASARSSKTPSGLRRSVQASSGHDRVTAPADPFASPPRIGGRKLAYGPKSPAAPHSAGYAARHVGGRPVYTAVGISTPTAPSAVAALAKSATTGLRASAGVLSPGRPRRQQQQHRQPALNDVQPKASPLKVDGAVGNTTSAVIAALAMDAALPDLDPTAMALLETILGAGSAAASPVPDAYGLSATGSGAAGAKSPADALRSPLGQTAGVAGAAPQPTAGAGTSSSAAAEATKPMVLTQQLLQQHQQQFSQAAAARPLAPLSPSQQQQESHRCPGGSATAPFSSGPASQSLREAVLPGPVRLGTTGLGAETIASTVLDGRAPRSSQPQTQLSLQPTVQPLLQPLAGQGSFICTECGSSSVVGCGAPAAVAAAVPKARAPPPSPALVSPDPVEAPLAQPLEAQHLEHPHTALLECSSQGGSGLQGISAAVVRRPQTTPGGSHPGVEDTLTARTSRALEQAGDSPLVRRPPGSHSATNIQQVAGATAAGSLTSTGGAAAASPLASPGGRAIIKRLCKSHAAGTLSIKMIRSPKDDPRRPTTYAELQCISKQHHQQDQPSSPRQQQQPQLDRETGGPSGPDVHPQPESAKSGGAAATAAVTGTATAAAIISNTSERPSSSSRPELDASSAPTRMSPYGPMSGGRLTGSNLMLPETIVERGSTSVVSEAKTPTLGSQQRRFHQHQTAAPPAVSPVEPTPKPGKHGLFGGLLKCLGLGKSKSSRPAAPAAQPTAVVVPAAAAPAADQTVEPQPAEAASAAVHPAGGKAPLQPPKVSPHGPVSATPAVPAATATAPPAATSAVAAVAAALSMSPNTAAAHINSDSRLLTLLRAELAVSGEEVPEAATATVKTPPAAEDAARPVTDQNASGGGSSPRTPRASRSNAGSGSARPPATPPVALAGPSAQPWQSRSPLLPNSSRQQPGVMPASPDAATATADANVAGRSPMGHLCHEDGDSVLRGSVEVHGAAAAALASSLSFSPSRPVCRPQNLPRATSAVAQSAATPPRCGARQPLGSALEVAAAGGPASAAAASTSGGSGRSSGHGGNGSHNQAFLEPLESDCREHEPELHPQQGSGADRALEVPCQAAIDLPANAQPVPTLVFSGGPAATTPAPRSSRKRSRATHGCGGGALSQLDARKLAAMPLEEMLEHIQAAIAAEDLATGRTVQVTSGGGGLSDDCSILPMPPVMVKPGKTTSLRRRKSGAGSGRSGSGGGGHTAGHHSGGGSGGGPSRAGRSSDGGTRGGAAVGAVQTTLMKAAAATASVLGGGRRRRRVRNRSSPVAGARRRQTHAPDSGYGGASFGGHPYGISAPPVSPNSRKSDGASSYGLPVWRHGGRALACNGLRLGGITSNSTSPRSQNEYYFARQPPYKKAQLCTPGASTAVALGALYLGGGGLIGGSSPPRLRQSAPGPALQHAPPPPVAAVSKTPMPHKTPGVVHTHVRAARRLMDADDFTLQPMSYTAALAAATSSPGRHMAGSSPGRHAAGSSPSKHVAAAATAKKVALAPGPITSSHVKISDLLSRYKVGAHATPVANALTTAVAASPAPAPWSDAEASPASAGKMVKVNRKLQLQPPQPQMQNFQEGNADDLLVLSPGSPVQKPARQALMDVPHDYGHTHVCDGNGGGSGASSPHKPRIASVSLTELLQRASATDKQRQPSCGADPGRSSAVGCSPDGGSRPDAPQDAEAGAPSLLQKAPEEAGRSAIVGPVQADGAAVPPSCAVVAKVHLTAPEPARTSVGYLELLQAYNQTNGYRTAAVPHYAIPIASRATSAGGVNGSTGGAGDVPAVGESPARRTSGYGSAGGAAVRASQAHIGGSYAHIAAMRQVPTVAASPSEPAAPAAPTPGPGEAAEEEGSGETHDCTVLAADAASVTGSPMGDGAPASCSMSPTTSSVLAHLPSARGAASEATEVLESTAAVRSDGVRMLDDTADSGGRSDGGAACATSHASGEQPGCSVAQGDGEKEGKDQDRIVDAAAESVGCQSLTLRPCDPEAGVEAEGEYVSSAAVRASAVLLHVQSLAEEQSAQAAPSVSLGANTAPQQDEMDVAVTASDLPPQPREHSASAAGLSVEPACAGAAPTPTTSLPSPCCVDLPGTPKRAPGSPFADWRCVPLAAYEASAKEYEVYFAAPADDD